MLTANIYMGIYRVPSRKNKVLQNAILFAAAGYSLGAGASFLSMASATLRRWILPE